MGDHLHAKGEWMVSYRTARMDMQGNRIGSTRISARDTVGTSSNPGQFLIAPTRMPMQMHMLGLMHGVTDRITLLGMLRFVDSEMDHLLRNGRTFTTKSAGLGDSQVAALFGIHSSKHHAVHINLGLSLPTGSIKKRDDTPAMSRALLPYPMQLGSGTYDVMPGITYRGSGQTMSWGLQALATLRTSDNDSGYRLGDQRIINGWLVRDFNSRLSLSVGIKYQHWDNIKGQNPALNPALVQTANPQLQAGDRLNASVGANYLFSSGHRLAIEYSRPVSQNLNGPQLETDSVITLGWQKAF